MHCVSGCVWALDGRCSQHCIVQGAENDFIPSLRCTRSRATVCMFSFLYSLYCRHYSALTLHDQIMSAKIVFFFFFLCILLFVYVSCSYLPWPYLTPSPSMPLRPANETNRSEREREREKPSATPIDDFINSCPLICLAATSYNMLGFLIFRKIALDGDNVCELKNSKPIAISS